MGPARINKKAGPADGGSIIMDVELLKSALQDPKVNTESTENARSVAVSARQESRDAIARLDEQVQLDVAKAAGANVGLGHPAAIPED
jgi:hypothetical protein